MDNPKISIILATHNRKDMLPRMMESLNNQTFKEYELVLIDDGSKDGTAELCKKYVEEDSRIILIILENNQGLSNARNLGVSVAKTDLIAFIDDDDFCEEGMFEHLFSLIIENGADIAVTGCMDEYPDKCEPKFIYDELYVFDRIKGLEAFLSRELFHTAPPTKLFRKSLFDGINFIKGAELDDIHVMYKLFEAAKCVVCQGLPMYKFRKHGDNITSFINTNIFTPRILEEYFHMQRERVKYISEKVPELTSAVRYAEYSYLISIIDKIITYNCENCDKQLEYIKRRLTENKQEFLSSPRITEREKSLMNKYF